MSPYIEISNLRKTFQTPAGEFNALRDIDYPTSGSIRTGSTHLQDLNEKQMAAARSQHLSCGDER